MSQVVITMVKLSGAPFEQKGEKLSNLLVSVGDFVEAGQSIAIVENEHAKIDVPSAYKGVVTRILAEVGQAVPPFTPLLELDITAQPVELVEARSARALQAISATLLTLSDARDHQRLKGNAELFVGSAIVAYSIGALLALGLYFKSHGIVSILIAALSWISVGHFIATR